MTLIGRSVWRGGGEFWPETPTRDSAMGLGGLGIGSSRSRGGELRGIRKGSRWTIEAEEMEEMEELLLER